MSRPLDDYCALLEGLTIGTLAELDRLVSDDVVFRDPFHDVRGKEALRLIFRRMFEDLAPVRFEVTDRCAATGMGMIRWVFHGQFRGRPFSFAGMSRLQWNDEDCITLHEDYWDAAGGFYEQVPVLGRFMRALRRRIAG